MGNVFNNLTRDDCIYLIVREWNSIEQITDQRCAREHTNIGKKFLPTLDRGADWLIACAKIKDVFVCQIGLL